MWPSLKLRFRFGTPFDRALLEFAQNNFLGGLLPRSRFSINSLNPEALSVSIPSPARPHSIIPPTARWLPLWPKSCLSNRNEPCSSHFDHLSGEGESDSLRGGWRSSSDEPYERLTRAGRVPDGRHGEFPRSTRESSSGELPRHSRGLQAARHDWPRIPRKGLASRSRDARDSDVGGAFG